MRTPLVLPLACLCLAGCGESEGAPAKWGEGPVKVEVVRLEPGPLRNVVRIPGQLVPSLRANIRPEFDGILETVEVAEGAEVTEGTLLFRMRDHERKARLAEAQAELALAEDVHRRTANLARRNVSSGAQLDGAAAELAVAQARVDLEEVRLARTEIRAPFPGVLGAMRVSPGNRIRKNTTLVELAAVDRLQLQFNLPEAALGLVRVGAPVEISVAPYPGETFHGEIYFVSPILDPAARRFLLKAWIPNADHRLRPGLFAQIVAEIERRDDALMLPEAAVGTDLEGAYVWRVAEEERAERVRIETGLRAEGRVEIRAGLTAGDRIVSAGIHKVSDGKRLDPVLVAPAEPPHESARGEERAGAGS